MLHTLEKGTPSELKVSSDYNNKKIGADVHLGKERAISMFIDK